MPARFLTLGFLLIVVVNPARGGDAPTAFFENQVRPLLVKACQKCHGPTKQQGSLRLDSRDALMRGGDAGPAVVPGEPGKSLLIRAIAHKGDVRMPPKGKLSEQQVATLTRWVEMGAPWSADTQTVPVRSGEITDADRRFWSFQPVKEPVLPPVQDMAWPVTALDRFILARLEAKNLRPAPLTDKQTLIRRATFDLTGLPPTPEEIDAFLKDETAEAFGRVVDRLLASPAYGERWGRHWLDVVHYADTAGETADYPVPQAYLYRNYVIDSFNADKPYDVFLREQVAGDILAAAGPPEKYAERVTATGLLAISRRFGFDPENYQHLTIQDTIDTLGQATLGLTLGCARCHDHKFDPVSRHDYYALYGIFDSTRYPYPGSEKSKRPVDFVPLLPTGEAASRKAAFDVEVGKWGVEIKKLESEKNASAAAEARRRLDELQRTGPYPLAYAVAEDRPHNARIQKRGEPADLGDEVPRRFLEIFGGDRLPVGASGSGRLALAEWLTRPSNPLTARVMVNRVWQHHFGTGLVATPNDFGARGRRPTHPELLEYLAWQFQHDGWSLKKLHRLMLTSRVYQLSSHVDAPTATTDPENQLLAHYPRQRLDAESLRDAMLAISGKLDRSMGGPHPFPPVGQWNFTQHTPFTAVYDTNRRSVYLMTQRLKRHPYLALFDGPDPNASTPKREPTTVPTQALFLMNDPFVHEQARAFAEKLVTGSKDERERIDRAYRSTLGRLPTPEELQTVVVFLDAYRQRLNGKPEAEAQAWAALARTLFARNEFFFVD
jgi:hypothetical protein